MASETEQKVLRQIDFYFNDSNFRRDKFLTEKANENPEGWVDLNVIATFQRLKSLTEDLEVIRTAVSNSGIVELNDDRTKIRRKNPLPEKDDSVQRTVYVRQLRKKATLEELFELFESSVGCKVASIRVRRDRETKEPNGQAFVEWVTQEGADKCLNTPIVVKWTEKEVVEPASEGKEEEVEEKELENTLPIITMEDFLGGKGRKAGQQKRKAEDGGADNKKEKEFTWDKGLIIRYQGGGPAEGTISVEQLFVPFGPVGYIELDQDTQGGNGFVRMKQVADAAKAVEELTAKKAILGDQEITVELLTGEEEAAYWEKIKIANNNKRGRKRGGRGRRY